MKLLALSVALLALVGCSSSKDDSPKPVPTTPFGKASAGTWLSECQNNNAGFFKDTLALDGVSSGSSTMEYYNDNACTQLNGRKDAPQGFTYTAKDKAGLSSHITIRANGQVSEADVIITGSVMKVTVDGQTVTYVRLTGGETVQQRPIGGKPDGDPNAMQAFDRLAVGTWVMRDCQGGANKQSYVEILVVDGGGRGTVSYNVFDTPDCKGNPTATRPTPINYSVNSFVNGRAEILLNNEPVTVAIANPTTMAVTSNGGTANYVRVK